MEITWIKIAKFTFLSMLVALFLAFFVLVWFGPTVLLGKLSASIIALGGVSGLSWLTMFDAGYGAKTLFTYGGARDSKGVDRHRV